MIEDQDGIEVVCNVDKIFVKHIPRASGAIQSNTSQGRTSIPPPTTISSIPTHKISKVTTTILPASSLIPSLGIFIIISNPFVASHIICPITSLPRRTPLTCPSYTYTLPPYSPPY